MNKFHIFLVNLKNSKASMEMFLFQERDLDCFDSSFECFKKMRSIQVYMTKKTPSKIQLLAENSRLLSYENEMMEDLASRRMM